MYNGENACSESVIQLYLLFKHIANFMHHRLLLLNF